jgi:ABC-type multidrug transport system fused ATPase/permease subunit
MKKNNSYLEDEIDLSEIIKALWNEKILILSISLFFMVAGYVYGALQPNIYKTEITIREAPSSLFEAYRPFFSTQQQQQQGIARQFNDDLKLNLSSLDTLVQFVENNNTINDFKNHLKEKNIDVRDYFREKFESVIDKKNNIQNKYSFTYLQPLSGPSFLNDYIIMDAIRDFCGQKTIILIAHRLKTVQKCDTIFMIDQGQVSAQGTFEELLKTNEHFKRMASHA